MISSSLRGVKTLFMYGPFVFTRYGRNHIFDALQRSGMRGHRSTKMMLRLHCPRMEVPQLAAWRGCGDHVVAPTDRARRNTGYNGGALAPLQWHWRTKHVKLEVVVPTSSVFKIPLPQSPMES